jgi:apolipoprotein N-acyltransferase
MSDYVKMLSLYVVAGALLGVPFVEPSLWLSGLLGVAVFLYATTLAKTPSAVLWGGFIAWTTKSLIALSWGWSIWPLDSFLFALPLSGFWGIALYWISGALFLGLGGAFVAGWLWYFLVNKKFETSALLALPFLWLLGEVLAAQIFSVMTVGPNGFYTAAFSYGQIGYILAEHNLLLLVSKFGGLYALSITAVALGVVVWLVYTRFQQRCPITVVGTLLILLSISGAVSIAGTSTTTGGRVAVVDTEFNNQTIDDKDEILLRTILLGEAMDAALATGAEYVVLPEGARFNDANLSAESAYRLFQFQSGDVPAIVIDSGRAKLTKNTTALRATIYDGVSKQAWQVDKQYLVPQGEYVPQYFGALFSFFVDKEMIARLSTAFDYVPGPYNNQTVLPDTLPRILFCHSSADPVGVRKLLTDGAQVPFIAHPISHAWFGGSQILKDQQTAMLRIQALWNDVAIISAGNMTKGELYDKDGTVRLPVVVANGEGWTVSVIDL